VILLPTVVPPEFGHTTLTVDRDGSGYHVTIGLSSDCHAYTACALAIVEGSVGSLSRSGRTRYTIAIKPDPGARR
jgi:hypothetical protein